MVSHRLREVVSDSKSRSRDTSAAVMQVCERIPGNVDGWQVKAASVLIDRKPDSQGSTN